MRILLAIDDSKYSEAAMQAIVQQMRPEVGDVCILHVVKPLLIIPRSYIGRVETLEAAQRERMEEGKELVGRTGQLLSQAGFKVHADVEEGDPRTAIIDYAARWQADLIILGSHGKTGLDKFLLGSVSEAVIRHAHCSVEVVRDSSPRVNSK
jgi:nucleotide-binding universal stress UspA family protein